jgi:glycosyltransferase involved in cell wall biosynthesis
MGIVQDTVVVVPCYNEAARLDVPAFEAALEREPKLRLLLVDDGSKDDTKTVLQGIAQRHPRRAECLPLAKNSGKAEAVRQGVLQAFDSKPELVGYWDADLATPLEDVTAFAKVLEDPKLMIVLGSRVRLLGRHIERTTARHYIGRVFASAASVVLGLPIYDTQCGAKLFRATPLIRSVFERPFELNWCFDVEMLARLLGLEAQGQLNLREQCVEFALDSWVDAPGSKLNVKQIPKVLGELARLGLIVRSEKTRPR